MTDIACELSNVLNYLLEKERTNETQLAKRINIPRPTLRRLIYGQTPDPRASTLNSIAEHFGISVDELIGKKPLSLENDKSFPPIQHIPVIKWEEIPHWEKSESYKMSDNIITLDSSTASGQFAVYNQTDAMLPQFHENCLLVIDTQKSPRNRHYVIAYIDEINAVVFRQLYSEGKFQLLKSMNEQFPTFQLGDKDRIIGVVTQVRKNLI